MTEVQIRQILSAYGVMPTELLSVQKGYRNESYACKLTDGQMGNLIIYKQEPGIVQKIQHANFVADYLAAHNFPARRTMDDRIILLRSPSLQRYASLYTYLPGKTIPWEDYTKEHIKQLGATMSDMHALLKSAPRTNLESAATQYARLCARMQAYFEEPGVAMAMAEKLQMRLLTNFENFKATFDALETSPGQQPLHMDFVRGNILFANGSDVQLSGVLDFEKAVWGSPAFDMGRTLAFLLVDCKRKPASKVYKYFLRSGYSKRGKSNYTSGTDLETLIEFFLLHDFYKFLRHNPYENLYANEHYIRTFQFLIQRGSIAKIRKNAKISL